MSPLVCGVCGGDSFRDVPVLWDNLVADWQLSARERAYIDRQQGLVCEGCGASLRIMALSNAIRSFVDTPWPLSTAIQMGHMRSLRILDCNGAVGISDVLSALPNYQRADYPEHDMRHLPFPDGSFDLVIHSDTLEHIEHPIAALDQCRRVLAPGGRLCFTVPVIHGRLSRDRAGLSPSHHGDPATGGDDFRVHTEFGADVYAFVYEAGFTNILLNQLQFPAALAISAWTEGQPQQGAVELRNPEQELETTRPEAEASAEVTPSIYDQDGLRSIHNHDFMKDPAFQAAYARGVGAAGADYHWHWRVHVGLWAANMAFRVPGSFIEFGVNRGFLSSAIMQMLDWNATGRRFFLLDTFEGIDERYINEEDRRVGVVERNQRDIATGFYTFDLAAVRQNFSEWLKAKIIAGPVPETLSQVDTDCIAFAHIDMNCAPPEVAAAEFVWARMSPGGVILLDDYAYYGFGSQKLAMDAFAASKAVPILSLPTGQGLIIKPAAG